MYLLRNFHYQTNVNSSQIPTCVYCSIANFSLPYSGYVTMSGNYTLKNWTGNPNGPDFGITYNNNQFAEFGGGIEQSGGSASFAVPAGSVSVAYQVSGDSSGILEADITLSYHYWSL